MLENKRGKRGKRVLPHNQALIQQSNCGNIINNKKLIS